MKVYFYTLGCKVNQYDTQTLKELFVREGFSLCKKGDVPDVVVINTCTVTAESDRKGRQAVGRFAGRYPEAVIAVTGCMPQACPHKGEGLTKAHVVVGNASNEKLPTLVKEALKTGRRVVRIEPHKNEPVTDGLCSESFEGRTRAFVKIEDGCNRFCSYCLIPYARGRVRSKPLCELKKELERLGENGYKEVVLAGINLTAYSPEEGVDLSHGVAVAQRIPAIGRIRLGSMEPDQFSDELIENLGKNDKLCPQFHLSLQSGSDSVLARMNRHYDAAFYRELIGKLRKRFPGCAITTDVMCGFPGETDREFEETLAFMEEIGFAKVHAFSYSPREGTPAADRKDQVSPAVKKQRMERLLKTARKGEEAFLKAQVGKQV
ncbi:MAG: tRNA (N(6)-L-threonylcarbamoyladenosine(37)-C(2))-methylthiotransferase MtaB [Clostridia bacterium]|nr:tRNA (N(6)-L-threonylcarbamoyladenosine(37)-C(2))-methylthiotransferase MtaB [Clostridia bacterium]